MTARILLTSRLCKDVGLGWAGDVARGLGFRVTKAVSNKPHAVMWC